MRGPKGTPAPRTPQACDRCRRNKTKCNGIRPQCRSCLKRKVTCTWAKSPTVTDHSIAPLNVSERPELESRNDTQYITSILVKTDDTKISLLQHLVDIFLARHHDVELCSFFHRPSLDISALSIQSPFLVTSIISLSSLYISENEARNDYGFQCGAAMSDYYAQIARDYARTLSDKPSVPTIQAHLILAIRELITWTSARAWMYAGTAIRMAQTLHLGSESNQCHSPLQKEIRRRTFWACFVVDRLISNSCNQPFAINMLSARVQLPCPETAFAFEEAYSGPTLENIDLHGHQLSHLGITPFYITMVRLWGDMAFLHMSGGRRRLKQLPTDPNGEFFRCTQATEKFASILPSNLLWSIRNYKLHQLTGQAQLYVNLNFLRHHSKCVMHQEYLCQLDSQYNLNLETDAAVSYDAAGLSLDHYDKPIVDSCMEGINAITDMAVVLHNGSEQDRALLQSTFAASAIMTACAVHLWVIYTQTCDKCPKDVARAKADRLLEIIKSWQTRWRVAYAWAETLEMLYKLYEFSYGTGISTDLDIWETGTDIPVENQDASKETDANGDQQEISNWDGIPDPAVISQRLNDKIRSILVNPLLATNAKKRNLRLYCKSLWQYMWSYEPLQGFDSGFTDLEDLMSSSDLPDFGNLTDGINL